MKKYIYIITFVLLGMNLNAQSVWNGKREAIRKGSGTETDPHLIENAQNFAWLCYLINHDYTEWTEGKYFLLTTNIDLNGNEDNQWIPILAGIHHDGKLNINIDGGGHKISGLYIDNNSEIKDEKSVWYSTSASLFTDLSSSCVKNLYVEGYIHINDIKCAGIAGSASGNIENCKTDVDIETNSDAAGFVTHPKNGSNIINCNNVGNIKGDFVGGIVSNGQAKIESCYNTGNIEGGEYIGGLAGVIIGNGNYIRNSYNIGQIIASESTKDLGGIIGTSTAKIVNNCHYLNTCIENSNDNGEAQTSDFMRSQDFVDQLNKGTDVWCFDDDNINDGYPILSTNKNLSLEQMLSDDNTIVIFPNPATEHINIEGEIVSYKIYGIKGNVVRSSENIYNNNVNISVSDFTSGIYFVRCTMQNGNIITKKIIIK